MITPLQSSLLCDAKRGCRYPNLYFSCRATAEGHVFCKASLLGSSYSQIITFKLVRESLRYDTSTALV